MITTATAEDCAGDSGLDTATYALAFAGPSPGPPEEL
jgi:hypothetical protein